VAEGVLCLLASKLGCSVVTPCIAEDVVAPYIFFRKLPQQLIAAAMSALAENDNGVYAAGTAKGKDSPALRL
jgi:hypothetical protein